MNELRDVLKALGLYMKKEEINELMSRIDKDSSGTIEFEEFIALIAEKIVRSEDFNCCDIVLEKSIRGYEKSF